MAENGPGYFQVRDREEWDIIRQRMYLVTESGNLAGLALVLNSSAAVLQRARQQLRFREEWFRQVCRLSGTEMQWLKTGQGCWRIMRWNRD